MRQMKQMYILAGANGSGDLGVKIVAYREVPGECNVLDQFEYKRFMEELCQK